MRVLVTGGSGFTGRRVVPRLVSAGHEVVALARSEAAADSLRVLGARPTGYPLLTSDRIEVLAEDGSDLDDARSDGCCQPRRFAASRCVDGDVFV